MASRKILTIDKHEKILRTKSQPVKKITKDVKTLIKDIKDTIEDPDVPAMGLAAVQIGVLKRVFGAILGYDAEEDDGKMPPPTIFIDPELVEQAPEVERDFDACLSIPGMMGYTDRNIRIRVRYMDETGKKVEREFTGWDARVILHEMDHLDGILFLDRLESKADLFVYVKGKDGKTEPVPYLDIIAEAGQSTVEADRTPHSAHPAKRGPLKTV